VDITRSARRDDFERDQKTDVNVHLRWKANKDAADMLYLRMLERGKSGWRADQSGKRRRLQ
jgi:hypothetical protein